MLPLKTPDLAELPLVIGYRSAAPIVHHIQQADALKLNEPSITRVPQFSVENCSDRADFAHKIGPLRDPRESEAGPSLPS